MEREWATKNEDLNWFCHQLQLNNCLQDLSKFFSYFLAWNRRFFPTTEVSEKCCSFASYCFYSYFPIVFPLNYFCGVLTHFFQTQLWPTSPRSTAVSIQLLCRTQPNLLHLLTLQHFVLSFIVSTVIWKASEPLHSSLNSFKILSTNSSAY